jgi:hypothetical protein
VRANHGRRRACVHGPSLGLVSRGPQPWEMRAFRRPPPAPIGLHCSSEMSARRRVVQELCSSQTTGRRQGGDRDERPPLLQEPRQLSSSNLIPLGQTPSPPATHGHRAPRFVHSDQDPTPGCWMEGGEAQPFARCAHHNLAEILNKHQI